MLQGARLYAVIPTAVASAEGRTKREAEAQEHQD